MHAQEQESKKMVCIHLPDVSAAGKRKKRNRVYELLPGNKADHFLPVIATMFTASPSPDSL